MRNTRHNIILVRYFFVFIKFFDFKIPRKKKSTAAVLSVNFIDRMCHLFGIRTTRCDNVLLVMFEFISGRDGWGRGEGKGRVLWLNLHVNITSFTKCKFATFYILFYFFFEEEKENTWILQVYYWTIIFKVLYWNLHNISKTRDEYWYESIQFDKKKINSLN